MAFYQPWRFNQQQGFAPGEPPPGGPSPKIPPPPSPGPRVPGPAPRFPSVNYVYAPGYLRPAPQPPSPPPAPKLQVSPFLSTIYKSIQNIDPEIRSDYLQSTANSIKERLDRYEFRLARGIPLTPEQQSQYESLRASFNDIQNYINNPAIYDEYFANLGKPTPMVQPPKKQITKEDFVRLGGYVPMPKKSYL